METKKHEMPLDTIREHLATAVSLVPMIASMLGADIENAAALAAHVSSVLETARVVEISVKIDGSDAIIVRGQ